MFLKFTLVSPQTGKSGDETYIDTQTITCWQGDETARGSRKITRINLATALAFLVDETFAQASARILAALALSEADQKKHYLDAAEIHRADVAAEAQKKSPLAM